MGTLVHPFVPIVDDKATCLILGSFPSVLSRQNNFYYGNPRNRFWQMLSSVLGEEAPADIPGKIEYLLRHGIALWDVLASCRIKGSGDASIREATANDIPALLDRAPIRQIFCNGRTAGR
jgi:hypoxanthine-DNA glycosylase